jgi:hypothetical protein
MTNDEEIRMTNCEPECQSLWRNLLRPGATELAIWNWNLVIYFVM